MKPLYFSAGLVFGFFFGCILAPEGETQPKRPAIDWTDPDNAPPAFDDVGPHAYEPAEKVHCCKHCGGGKKHAIHSTSA